MDNKKNYAMKRDFITLFTMAILCVTAHADDVQFTYDAGGNRISRAIVLAPLAQTRSAGTEETDSTQQQPFTDVFAGLNLLVYPNPTEGHMKIELRGLPEGESFSYIIVSAGGNVIINEKEATNPSEADLSAHFAGLYVLKLFYKDEKKEYKIIKL